LVVEPDDEARDAIEGALRSIGIMRTFGAQNASHAIEISADLDLDLLLCDVTLDYPEGDDGLSFVLDIREDRTPLDEDIPILFFAGDAGSFSVMEAKRLGVHDFLAKPVPLKRLEFSLQRLIRSHFPTRVQPST
jgi:CheY-like chemotaxis protein